MKEAKVAANGNPDYLPDLHVRMTMEMDCGDPGTKSTNVTAWGSAFRCVWGLFIEFSTTPVLFERLLRRDVQGTG